MTAMGCMNIHTKRVGEGIRVSSVRAGEGLKVSSCRVEGGLKVSCGLVCSVNTANVLKVEPKHIFLMEANGYTEEVCVISNVEWYIDNNELFN